LPSHFWLDETGTFWATGGGLAQLPARCAVFPLSLAYAAFVLGIRSLGAAAEWVFRLPSFLAVSLATFVLFRIARHLWGDTAAWLSVAMFVSLPGVSFTASNARPYGFGLLFVVLSTSLLLKLLDKPCFIFGLGYGATAALAVHFHLLFALAVVAHAIYFCYRLWRGQRVPLKYIISTVAIASLFISPLIPSVYSLGKNLASHTFASSPRLEDLLAVLFPLPLALCLLIGFAFAAFIPVEMKLHPKERSDEVILAALVAAIPVLVVMAGSRVSKVSLWLVRYFLSYAVGLALCFGAFASAIRPSRVARFMALCLAALNLYTLVRAPNRQTIGLGDWASGVAYVDDNTAIDKAPVLIRSQYIESDGIPANLVDNNPMFSQLSRYPSKSRLIGIGASFGNAQAQYIDGLLKGPLHDSRRVLVLAMNSPRPLAPMLWYLAGRLGPNTQVRELADFDNLKVIELARTPN
jgi:hypothetical protein